MKMEDIAKKTMISLGMAQEDYAANAQRIVLAFNTWNDKKSFAQAMQRAMETILRSANNVFLGEQEARGARELQQQIARGARELQEQIDSFYTKHLTALVCHHKKRW